jgi:ribonuclease HI
MAKKKFYGVARGRKPGIYTTWPAAEAQVKGFPGAVYKGFFSRSEAEAFLKAPGCCRRSVGLADSNQDKKLSFHDMDSGETVIIYTDGGSINNPGPGGYGIVQIYRNQHKERSGGFRLTTNNRMELMACIVALRELEYREKPVIIHSDSSYVVNGITKGWAKGWRRRGWRKSDNTPALNSDLWKEVLDLVQELDVSFKWVKGHAGHPLNERCDTLANTTARQNKLPPDEIYEKQQRSSL